MAPRAPIKSADGSMLDWPLAHVRFGRVTCSDGAGGQLTPYLFRIPPFLGVINAPLASPAAATAAGAGLFCGGAAATVTGANIRAVLLNVTQPEVRPT